MISPAMMAMARMRMAQQGGVGVRIPDRMPPMGGDMPMPQMEGRMAGGQSMPMDVTQQDRRRMRMR